MLHNYKPFAIKIIKKKTIIGFSDGWLSDVRRYNAFFFKILDWTFSDKYQNCKYIVQKYFTSEVFSNFS